MITELFVRPGTRARKWTRLHDSVLLLAGSLFLALSSQVAVRLPFSPVPITGQTLAVLLIGSTLGARRGAASVLLYLFEGVIGLPVFAGGSLGIARLLGPTGGYLCGFVAAAYIAGTLAERGWGSRTRSAALAVLLGNATIYVVGLPWLARFVGLGNAFTLGVAPFLPGDLVKMALATSVLTIGHRMLSSGLSR